MARQSYGLLESARDSLEDYMLGGFDRRLIIADSAKALRRHAFELIRTTLQDGEGILAEHPIAADAHDWEIWCWLDEYAQHDDADLRFLVFEEEEICDVSAA